MGMERGGKATRDDVEGQEEEGDTWRLFVRSSVGGSRELGRFYARYFCLWWSSSQKWMVAKWLHTLRLASWRWLGR